MRLPAAFWAAVFVTAQALSAGCSRDSGPPAVPPGHAGEPFAWLEPLPEPASDEPSPKVPLPASDGRAQVAASELEGVAVRVAKERVPRVSAEQPSRGPASAPVTIQVFSDFECPFCARAVPLVAELESELGPTVRVVWRNFPLPMHEHARFAAAAGLEVYATRGGAAFWRLHDALFAATYHSALDEHSIERAASREGVEASRLKRAVVSGLHDARIDADISAGDRAGVQGTPAFLVNDWLITGVVPVEVLRRVVERARREREQGPASAP